jgi:predicted HAD superfamily phosphohydrolase
VLTGVIAWAHLASIRDDCYDPAYHFVTFVPYICVVTVLAETVLRASQKRISPQALQTATQDAQVSWNSVVVSQSS